jgi:hypothetical protein
MFVYISFTLGDRAPGVAPIFVTSKVRKRTFVFLEQYKLLHYPKIRGTDLCHLEFKHCTVLFLDRYESVDYLVPVVWPSNESNNRYL